MGTEKKGESQSVRLRPSIESLADAAMARSGLSFPELVEFALILACPLAEKDDETTARHILVGSRRM